MHINAVHHNRIIDSEPELKVPNVPQECKCLENQIYFFIAFLPRYMHFLNLNSKFVTISSVVKCSSRICHRSDFRQLILTMALTDQQYQHQPVSLRPFYKEVRIPYQNTQTVRYPREMHIFCFHHRPCILRGRIVYEMTFLSNFMQCNPNHFILFCILIGHSILSGLCVDLSGTIRTPPLHRSL